MNKYSFMYEYQCIDCGAALHRDTEQTLGCICGRSYPIINGIPVLTLRPNALLAAHQLSIQEARSQLDDWQRSQQGTKDQHTRSGFAQRVQRSMSGSAQNMALIETYMKPVAAYLSQIGEQKLTFFDWISVHNGGWPVQMMLPYFYQDFGGTDDFERVRLMIVEALLRSCPDVDAVAVLGAGACGIAKATSEHFRVTYGVDLSMPTLLVAQGVLSGEAIVVHMQEAEWRAVSLISPKTAEEKVRLLVANANALPFADGSLSAVVTQYLLDIVGDPMVIAAEIRRVLKPGGIWVNFSNPLRVPGEIGEVGRPKIAEMQELLQPLALEVIQSERQRFVLLNPEKIYPEGDRHAEEVHFFVARKAARAEGNTERKVGAWRPQSKAAWWKRPLKSVPNRGVQLLRSRVFSASGGEERVEFLVNSWISRGFPVSAEDIDFIETFFSMINGERTAEEIFGILSEQRASLTEAQFGELLHDLVEHHGLLSIGA